VYVIPNPTRNRSGTQSYALIATKSADNVPCAPPFPQRQFRPGLSACYLSDAFADSDSSNFLSLEDHIAVRTLCLSALFFLAPILSSVQECKIKFAVVYNDGEKLQIGLTPKQEKMWDHDGPKKFKGLCADDKDPNYIIL
jgi:hypothetical protein